MERVKLPREVADALVHIVQTHDYPIRAVVEMFNGKSAADKDLCEYFEQDRSRRIEIIMKALVNGWDVEETPEDKVRALYDLFEPFGVGEEKRVLIKQVLNAYGHKVKGVNEFDF